MNNNYKIMKGNKVVESDLTLEAAVEIAKKYVQEDNTEDICVCTVKNIVKIAKTQIVYL